MLDEIKQVAEDIGDKFTQLKTSNESRLAAIEEEIVSISKKSKRPGALGGTQSDEKQKHALGAFIKTGDDSGLVELQGKSMSVGVDADGGYAVPEFLDKEVEKLEHQVSAIARLARTVITTSSSYKKVVNLRGTTSGWVGETEERPETSTPKLAIVEIPIGEIYANPKLTQAMIDDAMFDAGAFITEEIGEEFSDQLGAALFSGNGTNKPNGILAKTITTEADGVRAFGTLQAVDTETASTVSFDDLKNLKASLKARYRAGAAWIMNDNTALVLSKIKNDDGDYVWSDSVTAGEPDTLFGYPVEIDENAPDIGAGAYPVIFGNFQRGYHIVRRLNRRIVRDPYTSKPYVNFYATERVGGDVVNSECIKLLKVKAAQG